MNIPRVRITVRRMMAAVAVVAMIVWLCPINRRPSLIKSQYGFLHALALSPDEKSLATGGMFDFNSHQSGGVVNLWDLKAGRTRWVSKGSDLDSRFESLQFSADGKALFGLTALSLRVWDVSSGRLVARSFGPSDGSRCQAMSQDASVMAWACDSGIRLERVASGQEIMTIASGATSRLAFSADAKLLASARGWLGDYDQADDVTLWDLSCGKPKATLKGHGGTVGCLAFSPDGSTLAAGAERDGLILLWDLAGRLPPRTLKKDAGGIRALAFSPSGKTLASVDHGGGLTRDEITYWDVPTGRERGRISTGKEYVQCLVFSPGEEYVVAGCEDGSVLIRDCPP